MIKAVGFDVGHTLIQYDNPLNLSSLYCPALERLIMNCNLDYSEEKIKAAISVLTKYNTRINYREVEVSSDEIFGEIFDLWSADLNLLYTAKESFYSYIQSSAVPFIEVEPVLHKLKEGHIKIGVLTDVAYGMDNEFSLKDIKSISQYIDIALSSVDVGFRKPNSAGYLMLLKAFDIQPAEMLYVGDEEKDVTGANKLGIVSVLINRSGNEKDFGQRYTINSLDRLIGILSDFS